MAEAIDRDDPVKSLIELDPASGKFELSADGYIKWKPSSPEQEALNEWIGEEISQASQDHQDFFEQIRKNIEVYRGKGTTLKAGGKPVLTPHLVGREIDQMVAQETVRVMTPRPIVAFDPFFKASYSVPIETEDPEVLQTMGLPPGVGPVPMEVEYDSEEIAQAWAAGFDYKLRERLNARNLFKAIFKDIHIAGYSVVKNVYEKTFRTVTTDKIKKAPEGWIEVIGEREWQVLDGEPNKLLRVPQFSFLMPMDENDLQASPWISEDTPEDPTTFREKLGREYTLLSKDEWEKAVGATTDTYRQKADIEVRESIDRRKATKPRKLHDIKEVWFHYPVKVKEEQPDGSSRSVVRIMSFMGAYHMGLRKFLCIYRNPYRHGKRPYGIFFEDEEAGRMASASTVERVAQHQKLVGQMLHIDIQNAIHATNSVYWCDQDSNAWPVVTDPDGIGPGTVVPGKPDEEWGLVQVGRSHSGLMNQIGFIMGDLSKTTGVSEYEMGSVIPNRTAASTVSQIMEAGFMKPVMTMQAVSDCFAPLVRMWLEVEKQYNPFGEIVPTRDPDTQQLLQVPFRFPNEPVFDNFRIALTAADEELSKEIDTAETLQLMGAMAESGARCAQVLGAMADPNTSEAMTRSLQDLLEIEIEFQKILMARKRTDAKKFHLDKEHVDALVKEKAMALQMMQEQQAMMAEQQAMGGMGGGGPEAAVSGEPGAEAGGMGPMAPAPPDAGVPAGA